MTILAATDANPGNFAPEVVYGSSMHWELELLVQAGLTPMEVLTAATGKSAEVFGIENGRTIAIGSPATMVLIEGRPDKTITDSRKILRVWVNGKPILPPPHGSQYPASPHTLRSPSDKSPYATSYPALYLRISTSSDERCLL